jgi:hypothetical protein
MVSEFGFMIFPPKNMQKLIAMTRNIVLIDTASIENLPNSPSKIYRINIKLTASSKCFLQKLEWETLVSITEDQCIKRINWWAEGYDTGKMCM